LQVGQLVSEPAQNPIALRVHPARRDVERVSDLDERLAVRVDPSENQAVERPQLAECPRESCAEAIGGGPAFGDTQAIIGRIGCRQCAGLAVALNDPLWRSAPRLPTD
jgi:hypothetical protein